MLPLRVLRIHAFKIMYIISDCLSAYIASIVPLEVSTYRRDVLHSRMRPDSPIA